MVGHSCSVRNHQQNCGKREFNKDIIIAEQRETSILDVKLEENFKKSLWKGFGIKGKLYQNDWQDWDYFLNNALLNTIKILNCELKLIRFKLKPKFDRNNQIWTASLNWSPIQILCEEKN